MRFIDPNSTEKADPDPVILGKAYDLEGDAIQHSFVCKNCGEKDQWFVYNATEGSVKINRVTPEGNYFLKVELVDDNLNGPEKKLYEFNIQVKPSIIVIQNVVEVEESTVYNVTEAKEVEENEKTNPIFKIDSLDYVGFMKVSFSHSMRVVEDLTSFSDTNIGLKVIPDESND